MKHALFDVDVGPLLVVAVEGVRIKLRKSISVAFADDIVDHCTGNIQCIPPTLKSGNQHGISELWGFVNLNSLVQHGFQFDIWGSICQAIKKPFAIMHLMLEYCVAGGYKLLKEAHLVFWYFVEMVNIQMHLAF